MKFIVATAALALCLSIQQATAAGSEKEAGTPVAPRFLSQTGLYADAAALKIDSRNRNFSPQYPLWSDGATKRRWVRLPAGSKIDVADLANWELPVGTKFWKEFSFNGKKVETRFLWRTSEDNWVFASYVWNEAQTDAEIASEAGIPNIAEIADGKRHGIHSPTECCDARSEEHTSELQSRRDLVC